MTTLTELQQLPIDEFTANIETLSKNELKKIMFHLRTELSCMQAQPPSSSAHQTHFEMIALTEQQIEVTNTYIMDIEEEELAYLSDEQLAELEDFSHQLQEKEEAYLYGPLFSECKNKQMELFVRRKRLENTEKDDTLSEIVRSHATTDLKKVTSQIILANYKMRAIQDQLFEFRLTRLVRLSSQQQIAVREFKEMFGSLSIEDMQEEQQKIDNSYRKVKNKKQQLVLSFGDEPGDPKIRARMSKYNSAILQYTLMLIDIKIELKHRQICAEKSIRFSHTQNQRVSQFGASAYVSTRSTSNDELTSGITNSYCN